MPETTFPQIDFTITISVIVALVALISPVIVALINNHHHYKMRKMELINDQRFSAILKYMENTGKFIDYDSPANAQAYESSRGLIYLYAPSKCWGLIDELDLAINSNDKAKMRKTFSELCKQLSKAIKY